MPERLHPFNLHGNLTARLGANHAAVALAVFADWARSQEAIFRHAESARPWEDKANTLIYWTVARVTERMLEEEAGAAPARPDLSRLAEAVWDALADAGHTAASDSETGDGYQVGRMPGAVLVTVVRGALLTGLPWAATQRQHLQPWAAALTVAGFDVEMHPSENEPRALLVTPGVSAGDGPGEPGPCHGAALLTAANGADSPADGRTR